jgi:hypothetical protein
LPDPFLDLQPEPSSTNTPTTTTTTDIMGYDQQQKEQLQRGEGGGIVGRLDEFMKTRIGHMGCVCIAFLILAFDFFDNAETALLMSGIFTLEMVSLVFF